MSQRKISRRGRRDLTLMELFDLTAALELDPVDLLRTRWVEAPRTPSQCGMRQRPRARGARGR